MPIVSRYEISRGRTSELDRTGAGRATITMIDTNGSLDPSGSSTDYDPMTPVAIGLENPVNGTAGTIFRGHVSRWSYDLYPTERYGIATIECVDGLEVLAATEMHPSPVGGTASFGGALGGALVMHEGNIVFPAADQVKHRIDLILDQTGWPAGLREVFTGNVPLKKTVYAPRTQVLTAIDDACDAEMPHVANRYISRDGKFVFHGRQPRFRPEVAEFHIAIWRAGDLSSVNADSTRALISGLVYDRDKDRVINSAQSSPEGIEDTDLPGQQVENVASIAAYGIRSWSADNLLTDGGYLTGNNDLDETKAFAQYFVDNYSQPQTQVRQIRFTSLQDDTSPYADRIWRILCNVDISDVIRLETVHHGGAGGFSEEDYFVEGIRYVVQPLNDEFLDVELILDVSPRSYYLTEVL